MSLPKIRLQQDYLSMGPDFYSPVEETLPKKPQLLAFNGELASFLNLSLENHSEAHLAECFSGALGFFENTPVALSYAGHQFAHFVPQLGDGRALWLGETRAKDKKIYELQLKGSGKTPYSRGGDGKSQLGPVVREYILSEAMHALGVPTSRALAAIQNDEVIDRQETQPGGVFCRVAPSHIRVGSFQYFWYRGQAEALNKLLRFSAARHYPDIEDGPSMAIDFFKAVVEAQARLIAHWLDLGFVHGVMNTDNFMVGGFTMDYGPCAFLEEYKAYKVFSSIDRKGRYAYFNQPVAAQWNLARLGDTLLLIMDGDKEKNALELEKILENFKKQFNEAWLKRMGGKLGLFDAQGVSAELVNRFLSYLEKHSLDYTLSMRHLCDCVESDFFRSSDKKFQKAKNFYPNDETFSRFGEDLRIQIKKQGLDNTSVAEKMRLQNPLYIPRNHLVEKSIQEMNRGERSTFDRLRKVLKKPFVEQTNCDDFAKPASDEEKVTQTFCGT